MARRRPAQHPRLRTRFSQRGNRPPRTELPIDAGDPRRCVGGHRPQSQSQEKRLWTDQQGGEKILYVRSADEIEEADFITRTIREGQRRDSKKMTAVLYRTNAQSRAIEDALMRDGVAYRIIGGVRFYERKEIKDTLAYLRLLINPHDDVSFPPRRQRADAGNRQDRARCARCRSIRTRPTPRRRSCPQAWRRQRRHDRCGPGC
jgi:hypothetical protein